jgi:hypothetical protein
MMMRAAAAAKKATELKAENRRKRKPFRSSKFKTAIQNNET